MANATKHYAAAGALVVVWRNFSILGPKLVLAYAEDVLSDSRLKSCAKCKSG